MLKERAERFSGYGQMTWALQVMAILSIIVGLIILHTISREKARSPAKGNYLRKSLAGSFTDLRNLVRLEFGALGFSHLCSVALSSGASYLLSQHIFDGCIFHWQLPHANGSCSHHSLMHNCRILNLKSYKPLGPAPWRVTGFLGNFNAHPCRDIE